MNTEKHVTKFSFLYLLSFPLFCGIGSFVIYDEILWWVVFAFLFMIFVDIVWFYLSLIILFSFLGRGIFIQILVLLKLKKRTEFLGKEDEEKITKAFGRASWILLFIPIALFCCNLLLVFLRGRGNFFPLIPTIAVLWGSLGVFLAKRFLIRPIGLEEEEANSIKYDEK